MTTVREMRKELHARTAAMAPIEFGDLEKVNTFSRMELMKDKTRELIRRVSAHSKPDDWTMHKMMGEFDLLAMDWVYSNRLDWEGSLPDKQAQKIVGNLSTVEK